jgi:hypothetical protein
MPFWPLAQKFPSALCSKSLLIPRHYLEWPAKAGQNKRMLMKR